MQNSAVDSPVRFWLFVWLTAFVPAQAAVAAPAGCADAKAPVPPAIGLESVREEPYEPLRGFDRALALGVGHLRPALEEDRADWLNRALLPFSAVAGGATSAWLSLGWLVPAAGGEPRRLGSRGGLETGYETVSLIVLEVNAEGWLKVRYAPGNADRGAGWLDPCHLEQVRPRIVYEPWERFFVDAALSPLYLRTGGPRALRRLPEPAAELLAWIPAQADKYALEPVEIRGDWMRARLKVPSDYCAPPDVKPAVHEGWLRWRDARLGPIVWHYTRGC